MQNPGFLVKQVRMLQQRIAAEYDVALRPILWNSYVGMIRGLLSRRNRYKKQEPNTQSCSSAVRMPTLHTNLRLRMDCRYCSRFFFEGG